MIRKKRSYNYVLRTSFPKWFKERDKDVGLHVKKILQIMYDINLALGERVVKGLPVVLPYKLGEIQIYKVVHARRNLKYGKLASTGVKEYFTLPFEESYAPKLLWRKRKVDGNKTRVKLPFLSNYKFKLTSSWNKPLFEAITKDHRRFLDV